MDAPLEERAGDRVERLVRLPEVYARAAVAEVFETDPARRAGPERLTDRVVAPRLVGLHLGQPLPRSTDAAREEVPRDREATVADAPVARGVAPVKVFDPHGAVFDD